MRLFQQAEQGFDKLFGYNRQQNESFDYHNTMKNGSIPKQLNSQEQEFQVSERKIEINQNSNQEYLFSINVENKETSSHFLLENENIVTKQESYTSASSFLNQKNNQTSDVIISLIASRTGLTFNNENQIPKSKKKKKKGRRL